MSNIVKQEGIINFPDRSTKPSYAIAQYGILKHVVLSQYITQALISIGYLTKELKLNAFYSYNKAYIIQRKAPNKYRTTVPRRRHDKIPRTSKHKTRQR